VPSVASALSLLSRAGLDKLTPMRARSLSFASLSLVLAACGGGGATTSTGGSSPTGGAGGASGGAGGIGGLGGGAGEGALGGLGGGGAGAQGGLGGLGGAGGIGGLGGLGGLGGQGGAGGAGCVQPSDCPAPPSECEEATCEAGACGVAALPAGTPTSAQTVGDCLTQVCDGAGATTSEPDDGDPPMSASACLLGVCDAGVVELVSAPAGTSCGVGLVCDGQGACVGCLAPADCGADLPCSTRTCEAGACGLAPRAAGFVVGAGLAGDCRDDVCDGAGGVVQAGGANLGDVPPSDGVDCTTELCEPSSATPAFAFAQAGAACDDDGGLVCDGAGACVDCVTQADCASTPATPVCAAGVCVECLAPSDCSGGTDCTAPACGAGVCGLVDEPAGTACDDGGGLACDGAGLCAPPPVVLTTAPADGGVAVASAPLTITFSQAMDGATLTAQTSAGPCTGAVQVSLDDFVSCVAMSSPLAALSAGDTVATFTPAPGLLVNRAYRVRVTTAATSVAGLPLASTFEQASGFSTSSPSLCEGSLVISQVYPGGGNVGATYSHDFVELKNRGTTALELAGLSLQYASASGTTWDKVDLSGTIAPGGFFLVRLQGGANGVALPHFDLATASIGLGASGGKLTLVASTTALSGGCPLGEPALVDLVGYGTADCHEGAAAVSLASPATQSAQRHGDGCVDVGETAQDLAAAAVAPRSSQSPVEPCACHAQNEGGAGEADYCATQFPLSLTLAASASSPLVYGRLYEGGVTEAAGSSALVRAQLGVGPAHENPQYEAGWVWTNATFNVQVGNDDEHQGTLTAPGAPGSYRYAYRVSLDRGESWTVCDNNQGDAGAGSNPGLVFALEDLGALTVTP
jgi:hypothetical protein